ncbi:MAG: hypothetical protein ACO1SV_10360 [Fimbriimonas sp.]
MAHSEQNFGATRRGFLAGAVALGVAGPMEAIAGGTTAPAGSFNDLRRAPDLVRAFGSQGEIRLQKAGDGSWSGGGTVVRFAVHSDRVAMSVASTDELVRIQARWRGDLRAIRQYLGDHWERSYADMEWRSENPGRTMPWYFMAYDGKRTHGYGVRTEPRAFCFWNADAEGISLWADVRSGGVGVQLGSRTLAVCDIVCREGKSGESAFAATQAFCKQMCPRPRLADHPIYGTNDWNYAYGNNSKELIYGVSQTVSDLSDNPANRPYSVIDDGWSQGGLGNGPWLGNDKFGDMGAVATRLKEIGVRPGIWYRPLTTLKEHPESIRLARDKGYLDPTNPDALAIITENVRRMREWGYQMIKHDFTSVDIMGRWGNGMGASLTSDGWRFDDRSRTTAEVVLDLYRTIRAAAGDMRLIGCNTFSHLTAGTHEAYRTGDDTSGRSWERTRRMGVNTLAFRAAQHNAFYAVDPDIAAITKINPWPLTEQWLRLVAESGTALFVSVEPEAMGPPQTAALKRALSQASKRIPTGEPLDWMTTLNPRKWRLNGKRVEFSWMDVNGASPFGD